MLHEVSAAIPEYLWTELCGALRDADESAAVLLAGVADTGEHCVLTINQVVWAPAESYLERTPDHLKVSPAGWMPALKTAERRGLHPIFFHTHPGYTAAPSPADDMVDAALAEPFRVRAAVPRYTSLILGGTPDAPTFSGRVTHNGQVVTIGRLRIVGRRLRILPNVTEPTPNAAHEAVHGRQMLAFGKPGQEILASLHVGVVGAGGTGSAVVEQLTRLGVGHIAVVDDDRLTKSNVSRVYGSSISQDGIAKVEVAAANVQRIGFGTALTAIDGKVTDRDPLAALRGCDVVFGCTDDHAGRINLSKLAFWYLIPLIDVGVVIDSQDGNVRSIIARVTYVGPGEPCLVCRRAVDPNLARAEQLNTAERGRLIDEGYARGLDDADPSVIAYTTLAAATAAADLLERLFGFGAADIAGELIVRIADRKMKGRRAAPAAGHICARRSEWGLGDQPHFLGQAVWPQ